MDYFVLMFPPLNFFRLVLPQLPDSLSGCRCGRNVELVLLCSQV